jgi:hypothetical protein
MAAPASWNLQLPVTAADRDIHTTKPTMTARTPSPPQWVLDLGSAPVSKPKMTLADPPGYTAPLSAKQRSQPSKGPARQAPSTEEMDTLKLKKAWELAIAPAKQLPMSAIGELYNPWDCHVLA